MRRHRSHARRYDSSRGGTARLAVSVALLAAAFLVLVAISRPVTVAAVAAAAVGGLAVRRAVAGDRHAVCVPGTEVCLRHDAA